MLHENNPCAWTGIVGQVFGKDGLPLRGIVVVVEGTISGKPVELITLTGLAQHYKPQNAYEIKLSDQPFDSNGTLKISLYDIQGQLLSLAYPLTTSSSCDANLMMVNFNANPISQ